MQDRKTDFVRSSTRRFVSKTNLQPVNFRYQSPVFKVKRTCVYNRSDQCFPVQRATQPIERTIAPTTREGNRAWRCDDGKTEGQPSSAVGGNRGPGGEQLFRKCRRVSRPSRPRSKVKACNRNRYRRDRPRRPEVAIAAWLWLHARRSLSLCVAIQRRDLHVTKK